MEKERNSEVEGGGKSFSSRFKLFLLFFFVSSIDRPVDLPFFLSLLCLNVSV